MEAIKYYVKGAFQGVRTTPEVLEQQEELIADLTAKVADLVAQGRSEDEALGMAIASMGDLSTLVSEFELAEESPAHVPTASVFSTRLDLHVVAVSAGIGAAVMLISTVLGAWSALIDPGAGFALLAVLAVAGWWIRAAYLRYQESPGAIEFRELVYQARFRKALAVWAAVSFGATLLNLVGNAAVVATLFWCWPIWVAAGTWALTTKVEEWLVERAVFLAPEPDLPDRG